MLVLHDTGHGSVYSPGRALPVNMSSAPKRVYLGFKADLGHVSPNFW